jgi:hypothetical protein
MPNKMKREDFDRIYHQVFGKTGGHNLAWKRWQHVWASGFDVSVMHPVDGTPPAEADDDYFLLASCSELKFKARVAKHLLDPLVKDWENNQRHFDSLGSNDRSRARTVLQKMLVNADWVSDPKCLTLMVSAIAWLATSQDMLGDVIRDYRMFGYDIQHVPAPLGQKRDMFNFRFVCSLVPDPELFQDAARSRPAPIWRPPPH